MSSTAASSDALYPPLYGASIGQAFTRFWKKYATFSGRASRSEYWWWALISVVVSAVFQIISNASAPNYLAAAQDTTQLGDILGYVWTLATLVPSLALSWRRLHDTNRSGLWVFIGLIPLVGWIILLVFYVSGPKPEGARFDR